VVGAAIKVARISTKEEEAPKHNRHGLGTPPPWSSWLRLLARGTPGSGRRAKAGAQRSSFAGAKIGLPRAPRQGPERHSAPEPTGLDVTPRPFSGHKRMEAIVVALATSMKPWEEPR
jgi:hypothetical protein